MIWTNLFIWISDRLEQQTSSLKQMNIKQIFGLETVNTYHICTSPDTHDREKENKYLKCSNT